MRAKRERKKEEEEEGREEERRGGQRDRIRRRREEKNQKSAQVSYHQMFAFRHRRFFPFSRQTHHEGSASDSSHFDKPLRPKDPLTWTCWSFRRKWEFRQQLTPASRKGRDRSRNGSSAPCDESVLAGSQESPKVRNLWRDAGTLCIHTA